MSDSNLFITGTDTGVGKTLVACATLWRLRAAGARVLGMKPVASGAQHTAAGLRNADALALQAASSTAAPYELMNPYVFEPPIAPHLAARAAGVRIELDALCGAYEALRARADAVVVEGAGGWRLPLGQGLFLSDFAERLQLDVLLVVGLRLGCLNHAALTAEAILKNGRCRLMGWAGNQIDPEFSHLEENLDSLRELLPAPCLGWLAYTHRPDARQLATQLALAPLTAQ